MKMNYWVLADLHLGHDMMVEQGHRPFGFEELILQHIRLTVQPQDILIVLGDVCFYDHLAWHARLNSCCAGTRFLIRGNHDKKSDTWYYQHGWSVVCNQMLLHKYGKNILLTHKPAPESDTYDLNIHGHLHNSNHHPECAVTSKHRSLHCEHAYMPVNLRQIVER